jgi:hypothetical protein
VLGIYYCLVKAADLKQKATSVHIVLSCRSIELGWMATKRKKEVVGKNMEDIISHIANNRNCQFFWSRRAI